MASLLSLGAFSDFFIVLLVLALALLCLISFTKCASWLDFTASSIHSHLCCVPYLHGSRNNFSCFLILGASVREAGKRTFLFGNFLSLDEGFRYTRHFIHLFGDVVFEPLDQGSELNLFSQVFETINAFGLLMSSLVSLFICSCLFAPKRVSTLPERDEAWEGELARRSFHPLVSDPSRENTLLDWDEDRDFEFLSQVVARNAFGKTRALSPAGQNQMGNHVGPLPLY
ncbi:hypothetical protein Tco_1381342 [Tanacetum coccineum]